MIQKTFRNSREPLKAMARFLFILMTVVLLIASAFLLAHLRFLGFVQEGKGVQSKRAGFGKLKTGVGEIQFSAAFLCLTVRLTSGKQNET
jgi:hypothetical protein